MGLMDNVNRVINSVINVNDTIEPNENNRKESKSTDDIKKVMQVNDDLFDFMGPNDTSKIRKDVVKETNAFFNCQIRSGVLNNYTKKLMFKVLDEIEFYNGEEEVSSIELKSGEQLFIEGLEKLCFDSLINDRFNIKINFSEDEQGNKIVEFEPMYDYQVKKKKEYIDFIYCDYVERRFLNKTVFLDEDGEKEHKEKKTINHNYNNFFFYSYEIGMDYINPAVVEKALVLSELETAIQKEIKLGNINIFMDSQFLKGYNERREHYIPVKVPESMSFSDGVSYFFEVVAPALRGDQYQIYKDMLKGDMADLMYLDKSFTGTVQTTATEMAINNSQTIDTINYIKRKFKRIFNMFLEDFLGTDKYTVKIKDYVVKDEIKVHDQVVKELNQDAITPRLALKLLNYFDDDESDEFLTELYTNMYQNGTPFTETETEEAQRLGVLPKSQTEGVENEPILQ